MEKIREAILKCVYDLADDDDALIEALERIVRQDGEQVCSVFFNVLTHLDLEPETAAHCWRAVLDHRRELSRILNRKVNLRTVICDYFCSVDGSLKNPIFVEIHVFENHLKSLKFDTLTRLYTRATFEEAYAREFARARRYDGELSILFFDLDDFKSVNDMFGHLAGDLVLRDVGKIIKNEIRAEDSAARYGG
jgi:GGDEF domain-containing protein